MTQRHVLIHTYKCSRKHLIDIRRWAMSEQKYWITISGLKGQGKAQIALSPFSLANILHAKVLSRIHSSSGLLRCIVEFNQRLILLYYILYNSRLINILAL